MTSFGPWPRAVRSIVPKSSRRRLDACSMIPAATRPWKPSRLSGWEPSETVGVALLDQRLLAGVGNVIRIEACFAAAVSPWRRIGELSPEEADRLVASCRSIMSATVRTGHRPKRIYGAEMRPCPRCGERISRRGQGDANRTTSWCPGCQL